MWARTRWLSSVAAAASAKSNASGASTSEQHYADWGKHLLEENNKRIGPEQMFRTAVEAQNQIQQLTTRWNKDAKIYMCGSMVTYGVMEWGSDLDLCCLFTDPYPTPEYQAKQVFKLWTSLKKYMPAHLRQTFRNLMESRVPVVKLKYCNENKVARMRYETLTEEEDRKSRTALLKIKNKEVNNTDLEMFVKRFGNDKVLGAWSKKVSDGSHIAILTKTRFQMIEAIGSLPDGVLVTAKQREDLERSVIDERFVPEMFLYLWDINFQGYSVKNSYLIRQYLHQRGPVVRHAAMAVKAWGKATGVGRGSLGMLTSYGMTVLFVYYMLVTHQLEWIDPWSIPHPAHMPRYPDYSPLEACDPAELAKILHGFFIFYGTNFDYDNELVSLNRNTRRQKKDLGWDEKTLGHGMKKGTHNFWFCIEDPYEEVGNGGLNIGRLLHPVKFKAVKEDFQRAYQTMEQCSVRTAPDRTILGKERPDMKHRTHIMKSSS